MGICHCFQRELSFVPSETRAKSIAKTPNSCSRVTVKVARVVRFDEENVRRTQKIAALFREEIRNAQRALQLKEQREHSIRKLFDKPPVSP
mmetsp:Transcript_34045/g.65866  ORF Transcript_34045/g.65866 Transcript_34045/m.65866 type:complete len:91 (+) Transcript_34045:144-416(+)